MGLRMGGPPSSKYSVLSSHPVEQIVEKSGRDEFKSKINELEVLYGRHASIRRQMELNILSKAQRLPTLQSGFLGLDTILGTDENILPRDFMDLPSNKPERQVNLHGAMELQIDGHF